MSVGSGVGRADGGYVNPVGALLGAYLHKHENMDTLKTWTWTWSFVLKTFTSLDSHNIKYLHTVGLDDGFVVGSSVGSLVGSDVGSSVGSSVGVVVGAVVGASLNPQH